MNGHPNRRNYLRFRLDQAWGRQLAALQKQIGHAAHDQIELPERKGLYAELPELLSGQKPARQSDHERIFIRAIGLVNQDIAMQTRFTKARWKKASGRGCRTDL